MPPTLKDIAAKAGFSITTVSRALAGYTDVSDKTRQHILDIAQEMGYQPNQVARQLQGRRTQTLGLIMPPPEHQHEHDYFSLLIRGITYSAARHDYDLLISATPPGEDELAAYQRIAGGKRVDGLMLARVYQDDSRIHYLQEIAFPFVVIGRYASGLESNFPYIEVDSQAGLKTLTAHFIHYGHRQIGMIASPAQLAFTSYRLAGYAAALAEAGLPYDETHIVYGDLSYASGREAALQLLQQAPGLTAIVSCNDAMALGAMAALQERGYRIGNDIAIGGYDDIPAAAHANPPLTTIHQPIYAIGEQVAELLLALIEKTPVRNRQRLLQPVLQIRASSGRPRTMDS